MRHVLYHHGIKGQKWGVRRFQNKDGSLTPAGKERYGVKTGTRVSSINDMNSYELRHLISTGRDFTITKGQVGYRMTKTANETVDGKRKYLFFDGDYAAYQDFIYNYEGVRPGEAYLSKYEFKKDISVASLRTILETIRNLQSDGYDMTEGNRYTWVSDFSATYGDWNPEKTKLHALKLILSTGYRNKYNKYLADKKIYNEAESLRNKDFNNMTDKELDNYMYFDPDDYNYDVLCTDSVQSIALTEILKSKGYDAIKKPKNVKRLIKKGAHTWTVF